MPAAAEGNHGGDVGLAAQAAATRGSRPYGLSPTPITPRVVITTLSCAAGTNKSAPAGAFLTEMSDAGSCVGRLRSLLLQSADNASAALIPGQTTR